MTLFVTLMITLLIAVLLAEAGILLWIKRLFKIVKSSIQGKVFYEASGFFR